MALPEERAKRRNEEDRTQRSQAPKYCGVTRALDIIARFVRLAGYRHDIPLAVYKTADGHMLAICDRDVEKCMRHLASIVYNLDPEKDSQELQKWSCHSLRIGACVILHSMGCSAPTIKLLLRWRSDSFMEYVRNITAICLQQNTAITNAANLPNFY